MVLTQVGLVDKCQCFIETCYLHLLSIRTMALFCTEAAISRYAFTELPAVVSQKTVISGRMHLESGTAQ
jgi:hypothetical protein